jgi:hypothetical protein
MMKKILTLFFALVAVASAMHVTVADPIGSSRTPEQVGDLYLATMLDNQSKAKELNDYLLSHYIGENALKESMKPVKELYDKFAVDAASSYGKNHDNKAMMNATLAQIIQILLWHSTCHTTDTTIHSNDKNNSPMATVTYECHAPSMFKFLVSLGNFLGALPSDMPPDMNYRTTLKKNGATSKGDEFTPEDAAKIIAAINVAPTDKIINGKFDLHYDVNHHIWFINDNDFPDIFSNFTGAIVDANSP